MTNQTGGQPNAQVRADDGAGTPALLKKYEDYGLKKILLHIRQQGRYAGANGYNLLTNVSPERDVHEEAICETLRQAEAAGHRYRLLDHLRRALNEARGISGQEQLVATLASALKTGEEKLPPFKPELPPGMGFARGLNPYTDWTLSQMKQSPRGWLLVLGLDWYPISDLGDCRNWCNCPNPFEQKNEPFWRNTWAWLLQARRANADEALKFMREHGIGVIFHNVIPYLRPPGVDKSDAKWVEQEINTRRGEFVDDLRVLKAGLAWIIHER